MGRLSRLLREESSPATFLIGIVVVIRVIVVILVWLVLFLGVFVGYFTVPIFLVTTIVVLYSVTDIGLLFTVRRRERSRGERQSPLRKQRGADQLDTTD